MKDQMKKTCNAVTFFKAEDIDFDPDDPDSQDRHTNPDVVTHEIRWAGDSERNWNGAKKNEPDSWPNHAYLCAECADTIERHIDATNGYYDGWTKLSKLPTEANLVARARRVAKKYGCRIMTQRKPKVWERYLLVDERLNVMGTDADITALMDRIPTDACGASLGQIKA